MKAFCFNEYAYNLWPIYETIVSYYPIGVYREFEKFIRSYPGQVKLRALVEDQVHNEANFRSRWGGLQQAVGDAFQLEWYNSTYGQASSVSGCITLEKSAHAGITRLKRIQYAVSLLGPYYSIIGQDVAIFSVENRPRERPLFNVVSPINEYADTFLKLMSVIESQCPGYRFIPYRVLQMHIDGLMLGYADDYNCVYHAFFNTLVDMELFADGDSSFGSDDWKHKDGRQIGTWMSYPPGYKFDK